jgi:outer membrane protein OmpA-like peptidoglycan-associated protein
MGNQVNSESSEYCSVLPQKDSFLLFTKRSTESLNGKDAIVSMEDIFFSKQKNKIYRSADRSIELSEFENLSGSKKYHNAVVSIAPSGDTLMIYRNNKLWYSKYESRSWSEPIKLPKSINIGRNQRHATFSSDGRTMYFSSNARKGNGGYDLYMSTGDSLGQWSEAVNMGNKINSIGDEDSPFISKDGQRMYFASTGHMGFGKFDVFYSEWQDTSWSQPINAGKPINSPADDIYFHMVDDESETALLSSSRSGGFGQMDLYYFYKYGESKFENCDAQITQKIDEDSLSGLSEYLLIAGTDTVFANRQQVYTPDTFCIPDSVTNVFWKRDSELIEDNSLTLIFDSTQLASQTITLELLTRDEDNEEHRYCVSKEIYVKPEVVIVPEKPRRFKDSNEVALSIGSKLKEEDMLSLPDDFSVELESVYFSFNKYDIRKDQRKKMDANIALIKSNPNIIIKIIGHTDKVGSKDYNTKLSQKRAKSTVKYLTNKGVSINQIVAVLSSGEDEAGIRFKNEDGSDDVEKMEVSRRVDFYVIGKTK